MRLGWIATALLLMAGAACEKRVPIEMPLDPHSTAPQVLRFVAQPHIIHRGEQALITWNVRNAASISLDEALEPEGNARVGTLRSLGDFPAKGSLTVNPRITATYVLSCGVESESGLGCVSASVNIVVK